jgi:hypothetical protein
MAEDLSGGHSQRGGVRENGDRAVSIPWQALGLFGEDLLPSTIVWVRRVLASIAGNFVAALSDERASAFSAWRRRVRPLAMARRFLRPLGRDRIAGSLSGGRDAAI